MQNFDVIIIGAGAAGLMCAIEAGKRGRKVLLLDSNKNVGEKIRISGGGRCNFTNINVTPNNYISQNPNFCISALKRFTSNNFIELLKKHQISFHEKTLGQLFCDISSKQIIAMLLQECADVFVEIRLESLVNNVKKHQDNFEITLNNKEIIIVKSLVIATGGLSIPKMGASDFGYKIARQFGLKVINQTPALVPFTFPENLLEKTKILSGVGVEAIVTCDKKSFREAILFTHRGLSGPAILQISSYWQEGKEIRINLAPKIEVFSWLQNEKQKNSKSEIQTLLNQILPKSLVGFILENTDVKGHISQISNQKLKELANFINDWKVTPNGTEGFAKAEVTKGGVDVLEISSKTFEAKAIQGLYFIGEVLDVTGHLGGYNFQWAWSSGFCAGQFV